MQNQIGPAFGTATGYTFQGYGAGSTAVANAIKGKVKVGDVFISAAADADTALEGTANGNWVGWYSTFGSSPLLIGYNPASKFATDLKTMPWYKVLTMSGIKIGRTDPVSDPKGKLTVKALTAAQTTYKLPGFAAAAEKNSTVFPEETLVGRLQSGQLDAGFFYSLESTPKNIPTVTLGSVKEAATFTVTVLNNAPHPAGAAAFIAYLLGPLGTATLSADGMALKTPAVTGDKSAVPASLVSVVGG
jgi:molybdate/tungstate transport system substrate-binding protein